MHNISYEKEKIDILFSSNDTSPDTMMDLSIFDAKGQLVHYIIQNYGVPVGVVPIYAFKKFELNKMNLLEQIEKYAEMGVAFMTMHFTADKDIYEIAVKERKIPTTSRGGAITLKDAYNRNKQNIFRECLGEIVYLAKKYNIKWIATWNDPYMWIKYPAPYGKGYKAPINALRKKMIADIGKYTYKNVFPSERLKNYMLKYMTNMKDIGCVISPHIILDELITTDNHIEKKDTLKILHAGALGKERNPKLFFEGLRLFLDKYPNAKICNNLF